MVCLDPLRQKFPATLLQYIDDDDDDDDDITTVVRPSGFCPGLPGARNVIFLPKITGIRQVLLKLSLVVEWCTVFEMQCSCVQIYAVFGIKPINH